MPQIQYSEKYNDDTYEYRHVVLPPDVVKLLPKDRLLSETEWRAIGVQQSRGWVHYAIHRPEPHILLCPEAFELSAKSSATDWCPVSTNGIESSISLSRSVETCYRALF